jgi:heme/copper-type cytochrome/quinol oxidase subunit 2
MTEKTPDIPRLAFAYRRLILWFGAQIYVNVVLFFLQPVLAQRWAIPLRIALSIINFVIVVVLAYYSYRTAEALGAPEPVLWAAGVVLFNFIAIALLSSRAATICKEKGIPVGLLGPKLPS